MHATHTLLPAGCLLAAFAISAAAQTFVVDPATPLNEYTSIAEWETAGDFEGWSLNNVTDGAVTNGALQGLPSSGDPQVGQTFTNGTFAGGGATPDLSAPGNKTIEYRIRIETGVVTRIDFFYGTTESPGISGARNLSVPSNLVIADGEFHVYQLHVADVATWQGNLNNVRFDPIANPVNIGKQFEIDYIRIGGTVVSSSVVTVDGALVAEFDADPNKTYELQATDQIQSNNWSTVSTASSTGGVFRLVDPDPVEANKSYRVEIK